MVLLAAVGDCTDLFVMVKSRGIELCDMFFLHPKFSVMFVYTNLGIEGFQIS